MGVSRMGHDVQCLIDHGQLERPILGTVLDLLKGLVRFSSVGGQLA
jgi:hypothetical protein